MILRSIFWLLVSLAFPLWGKGILCLTFDDRHFESWLSVASLIESYDGHATFFPSGQLTSSDLDALEALSKRGHSIGSHTVSHLSVPGQCTNWVRRYFFIKNEIMPQVDSCTSREISLNCFAYPYGSRSLESDDLLLKHFKRLRFVLRPKSINKTDTLFIPMGDLKNETVLPSAGIGTFYQTDIEDLKLALERCHKEDACLILFSHGVYEHATGIDMSVSLLKDTLEIAKAFDVAIKGMDDL